MGADVLATQWAKASATMTLTMLNRNNSVHALNRVQTELKVAMQWIVT